MQYLVINETEKAKYLPYKEQYKLFKDKDQAIDHAISIGFTITFFGRPSLDEAGVMSMSQVGLDRVSILPLESV